MVDDHTRPPWEPRFETLKLSTRRTLGRGAFGEVFLVEGSRTQDGSRAGYFALKRSSLATISGAGLEKAKAEATLLQKLGEEHECILRCFDFRCAEGSSPSLDLLLEFAPLGDLSVRLKKHKESDAFRESAGLPEAEVVSFAGDVAAGLAYIHALRPKVLHRDVKPANVVLFPAAGDASGMPRAKLADFGIAKILESDASFANAATVIGTPHYFSPEICRGEKYDEKSDAWALGCIIYEMVCSHRPFHQAEGNIAILAIRVMEGRYDEEALAQQAGSYNGLLILSLMGLLKVEPDRRSTASDVLPSLQRRRNEMLGDAPREAVTWWQVPTPRAQEDLDSAQPSARGTPLDSWKSARALDVDLLAAAGGDANIAGATSPGNVEPSTLNVLQEVQDLLNHTVLPSPTWKRTSGLLNYHTDADGAAVPLESTITVKATVSPSATLKLGGSQQIGMTFSPSRQAGGTIKLGSSQEVVADTAHFGEDQEGDSPRTIRGEEAGSDLGATQDLRHEDNAELSATMRLDSEADGPVTECLSEAPGINAEPTGVPSRMAWMGNGMGLLVSETPPRDCLGETMGPREPSVGLAGQDGMNCEERQGGVFCHKNTGTFSFQAPFGEAEIHENKYFYGPRIFLRPLWRRSEGTPEVPECAPVMFCFTPEAVPATTSVDGSKEPATVAPASAERDADATPDFGQPASPPCEWTAVPEDQSPPAYHSDDYAADPAQGWVEVELTVENIMGLDSQLERYGKPCGIFSLTSVD